MRSGIWEIVLIVVLILILFGSAKIPAMAKNIANGIKTFKKEIKAEQPKKTTVKKKSVSKKK
nr:twin-arginine translocase TatA/TatE family subunit [Candidatus Enterousia merdequi]